eukprot:scaffold4409_cov369-Prasinococcus_capsulatus_cf.AAC.35
MQLLIRVLCPDAALAAHPRMALSLPQRLHRHSSKRTFPFACPVHTRLLASTFITVTLLQPIEARSTLAGLVALRSLNERACRNLMEASRMLHRSDPPLVAQTPARLPTRLADRTRFALFTSETDPWSCAATMSSSLTCWASVAATSRSSASAFPIRRGTGLVRDSVHVPHGGGCPAPRARLSAASRTAAMRTQRDSSALRSSSPTASASLTLGCDGRPCAGGSHEPPGTEVRRRTRSNRTSRAWARSRCSSARWLVAA